MSRIFVVSDTHFGHDNIIKYCDRPFHNYEDMDWEMVKRWNSVVREEDHVWHLGDVYMGSGSKGYIDHILGSLNGKKRLILGNHDNGRDQLLHKHFQKIVMWRTFKEFDALLTHVPVHPLSIMRDYVNVHGHIHNKKVVFQSAPDTPDPRYRCVCVEHTDYTPILLGETNA